MIFQEIHPRVTIKDVKANIGWDVKISPRLKTTTPPTSDDLRIIRQELDPDHIHLR